MAAKIHLHAWGRAPGVPWWLAIRGPGEAQIQVSLVSAIHLMAQLRARRDGAQRAALGRLMAEIIDDYCGPRRPGPCSPRPRAGEVISRLGVLAEGYEPGSLLREATLELCQRIVARGEDPDEAR